MGIRSLDKAVDQLQRDRIGKKMELHEEEIDEATWKLIGRELYWLRKRVNMPIFQFAERLGIPEDTYASLEAGQPNPELLERLSRYYGLSIRWFYGPRAPH
jgi:DNA-binding transcriptional regulator YiaG